MKHTKSPTAKKCKTCGAPCMGGKCPKGCKVC